MDSVQIIRSLKNLYIDKGPRYPYFKILKNGNFYVASLPTLSFIPENELLLLYKIRK